MDFDFNEDQILFQEATRDFLETSFDTNRLRSILDGSGFDEAFWQELAATGALSILVPEDCGGMGLDLTDLALVLEEYGRALVPAPVVETIGASHLIGRFGSPEQRKRWLEPIAAGRLKVAMAVAERAGGYEPTVWRSLGAAANEGWRITGEKILVPHAAVADLLLVPFRRGEGGELALALIEPSRAGVSTESVTSLDPTARFSVLRLDDVRVAPADILDHGAPAGAAAARLLDFGSLAASLQLAGIAARMLDDAVRYAGQRTQFGKPIGSFQAVKHRCADIAVAVDTARTAAYYAAWALANDVPDAAKSVSMAKAFCGEAARFACNEGIQIHGGIGFTWELGLHFYLKRAKTLELAYGDADTHRERVLAQTLAELQIGN